MLLILTLSLWFYPAWTGSIEHINSKVTCGFAAGCSKTANCTVHYVWDHQVKNLNTSAVTVKLILATNQFKIKGSQKMRQRSAAKDKQAIVSRTLPTYFCSLSIHSMPILFSFDLLVFFNIAKHKHAQHMRLLE